MRQPSITTSWVAEPKAIRKVEFRDGTSDDLGKPKRESVFPDGVAYEVTKLLQQNVQAGTGTRANIGCPAAGKTGTTDAFNDAWFVGYTPKLATSTWVGFPNALQSMPGVAGGTIPAGIWHDYMIVAKGGNCMGFKQPGGSPDFQQFRPRRGGQVQGGAPGAPYSGGGTGNGTQGNYYSPRAPAAPGPSPNGGGQNYNGYDQRLYDAPPQPAPQPAPQPDATPDAVDGGGDPDQGASNPDDVNP